MIYDAAHAFGIKYRDRGIGSYGDASIFSFHATKVFNTIEGGAVCFSEKKYYDKLYNLKNFGIRGEDLVVEVGANAKMNEFCAIMGLCNLKHIEEVLCIRKQKYEYYRSKLKEIHGISFFKERELVKSNYSYFPIIIEKEYGINRDTLYDLLRKNNIYSRKYFYPITADQACFRNKYKNDSLNNARQLSDKVLVLPFYEKIEYEQIDRIVKIIKNKI